MRRPEAEVRAEIDSEINRLAQASTQERFSLMDEIGRAKKIHQHAHRVVRTVMNDVRLGKAVPIDQVEEVSRPLPNPFCATAVR